MQPETGIHFSDERGVSGVELIFGAEGFDKAGNQVSEVEMRV